MGFTPCSKRSVPMNSWASAGSRWKCPHMKVDPCACLFDQNFTNLVANRVRGNNEALLLQAIHRAESLQLMGERSHALINPFSRPDD